MEKALGRRLCAARVEAGYKAGEFARLLGRTPRMLQRYEKGETPPPIEVLRKWAELTGKGMDYFLPTPTTQDLSAAAVQLPHQHHPGVETLAQDLQMRRRWKVTDAEIDELRDMVLRAPLDSAELAIMALQLLRTQHDLDEPDA